MLKAIKILTFFCIVFKTVKLIITFVKNINFVVIQISLVQWTVKMYSIIVSAQSVGLLSSNILHSIMEK